LATLASAPVSAADARGDDESWVSGSGFFFSDEGTILTNYHVAGRCLTIEVPGYGTARLLRGDEAVDLAALQLDRRQHTPVGAIRTTPPQLAESVVLLGYPLADLLNSSLNVATGIVSSETGLAGDADWFTTSAGVQLGDSGGPILDGDGRVIGIAVAKMDDAALLQESGTTAPNVGFGIGSARLLSFLSHLNHDEQPMGATSMTLREIAKVGRQFTVQIICREAAPQVAPAAPVPAGIW
jgi:S1-C subfamily serine protease